MNRLKQRLLSGETVTAAWSEMGSPDNAEAMAANGWPVLVFTRPVTLRSRLAPAAKPTLAALAVGGLVAVGSAIYLSARRRRTA
jgi:hypothetical protein